MKNIIVVLQSSYSFFEDYINSIKSILNADVVINTPTTVSENERYIFIQQVDKNFLATNRFSEIFMVNTEQLWSPFKLYLALNYEYPFKYIDYVEGNLKFYPSTVEKYLLPPQINDSEIYDYEKTKDVCIISSDLEISPRRHNVVKILAEMNINVSVINGFGKQRDDEVFKHKIILNIGYTDECNIHEVIRCDRCVYNKMIVISDPKVDLDNYYLKDYTVFEAYEKIPDKVKYVLTNYQKIHAEIFRDFNLENVREKIKKVSKDCVERLI